MINIYSNSRKVTPYIDIYSNVYDTVVYYDEILVVNLTFLITKNVDLNLIR